MRWLTAMTLYTAGVVVMPIDACTCARTSTPGSSPTAAVTATWDLRPRTLTWDHTHDGLTTPLTLTLGAGGAGALAVDGAPGAPVTLTPDGRLTAPDDAAPVVLDLLSAAPRAGALVPGSSATFRVPADLELRDDELTVQSEVRVTLRTVQADLATYDVTASYRVVDNAALASFRDATGHDPAVDAILDAARAWRLSLVGDLVFDLDDGAMVSATGTTAGLPLTALTPATLAGHPDASTWSLTLR